MSNQNQKFCSKCGTKLREGAKFCTSCGQKFTLTIPSERRDQSTAQVSIKSNILENPQIHRPAPITRQNINTSTFASEKKDNTTFLELIDLEREIDKLFTNLYTKEIINRQKIFFESEITKHQQYFIKIDQLLKKERDSSKLLEEQDWPTLKESVKDKKEVLEEELVKIIFIQQTTEKLIELLTKQMVEVGSEEAKFVGNEELLLEKEKSINQFYSTLLNGIRNIKWYPKLEKKLLLLKEENLIFNTNLLFLDKIINSFDDLNSQLTIIKKELNNAEKFGLQEIFINYPILQSFSGEKLTDLVNHLSILHKRMTDITLYANFIKNGGVISFPTNNPIRISELLVEEYFHSENIQNSIKYLTFVGSAIDTTKEKINQFKLEAIKEKNENVKRIDNITKFLYEARQEYLMTGSIKRNPPAIEIPSRTQKNVLTIQVAHNHSLQIEKYLTTDPQHFMKISEKIEPERVKSDFSEKTGVISSPINLRTQFPSKISLPTMPKLISMRGSVFHKPESGNEIKKSLEKTRYAFKKLRFEGDFTAEGTFYTGVIRNLIFQYADSQPDMEITAHIKLTTKKPFQFAISQEKNREPYSWEEPFKSVTIEETGIDERIKKTLLREKRIPQKLNAIKGKINLKVTDQEIIMTTEKEPVIITPIIDFLKELALILNLSFRF